MRRNKDRFFRWECPDCDYALETMTDFSRVNRDLLLNHPVECKYCGIDMIRVLPEYDPEEREKEIQRFYRYGKEKRTEA